MSKNLDIIGLKSIANQYDLFFIDLWGVVHNGINLHKKAIETLVEIDKSNKKYVLLTNAPRPNSTVKTFLKKLGMDNKILENVYTSGEAALSYLKKNHFEEIFYHIGPPRDFDLFNNFEKKKTKDIKLSSYILCTGLFDDHDNDLNYYKNLLLNHVSKKLICTNPDLIVHKGSVEELCAGSVAKVFEDLGGEVIYFGKPHKEVYNMCFSSNEKVLAIGDNLRTDIKGANNLKIDCIFITEGVHRKEFNNSSELNKLLEKYDVKANFFQRELKW